MLPCPCRAFQVDLESCLGPGGPGLSTGLSEVGSDLAAAAADSLSRPFSVLCPEQALSLSRDVRAFGLREPLACAAGSADLCFVTCVRFVTAQLWNAVQPFPEDGSELEVFACMCAQVLDGCPSGTTGTFPALLEHGKSDSVSFCARLLTLFTDGVVPSP